MKLTVGDKVRVQLYPPHTAPSFVEGIVDRSEVKVFDDLFFSIQMTREVILGRDADTPPTRPYMVRYEAQDEFEGRIEILVPAARLEPETATEEEPDTKAAPPDEAGPALAAGAVPSSEMPKEQEPLSLIRRRRTWNQSTNNRADHGDSDDPSQNILAINSGTRRP